VSILSRIALLVFATRVMNVIVAERTAQGATKMKTFTIDAENNITTHASRKAARETGAGVFTSEVEFADLIGPDNKRLVAIFNGLPGVKAVTKFANRKIATARIWEAMQQLGAPAPAESAPEQPAEATSAAPIPAVETPFDLPEAKPIPQETAPEAPTVPAAVLVAGQPSDAPEGTATVSAQVPDVAPPTAKSGTKGHPTPEARQSAEGAQAGEERGRPRG
jgi:hypothetical protein